MLPTHPDPEATHAVETILDYGCDWSYIVESNRQNIGAIGLRFFTDDCGVGHIGKTSKKVTKVVRYDAPNIVRHGGVSGFSEEFNIIPIGPHRTRVLLRQRFPKGPILSTLLRLPGTRGTLQYLVRNWNYQIGLEDYCVMQGQAHNIDDLGAPNWKKLSTGDDLIIKFWNWKRDALDADGQVNEYYSKWDGSPLPKAATQPMEPVPLTSPSHGNGRLANAAEVDRSYLDYSPAADYPPINYKPYPLLYGENGIVDTHLQALDLTREVRKLGKWLPPVGLPASLGAAAGLAAGAGVLSMTGWLAAAANAVGMQ